MCNENLQQSNITESESSRKGFLKKWSIIGNLKEKMVSSRQSMVVGSYQTEEAACSSLGGLDVESEGDIFKERWEDQHWE